MILIGMRGGRGAAVGGMASVLVVSAVMLEDCLFDVPGEWALVRVPSSMVDARLSRSGDVLNRV